MKYCTRCVMPDTRPGIKFNEAGVCSACQSYEKRKSIDWGGGDGKSWKNFVISIVG